MIDKLTVYDIDEDDIGCARLYVNTNIPFDGGDKWCDERRNQAADLVEAAPDLLMALKKIVNNWGNLHPKDRQQARAAIEAAKGKPA